MVKLLIVDDHVLFREGLVSLFSRQPDFDVVGEAGSVQEAIVKALELHPDLVLMDFILPDGTGLEATQAILADRPTTEIVFLTIEDDERLFAAIRAGAKGFLLKNVSTTDLLASLRGLQRGEAAISRKMVSRVMEEFAHTPKTGSPPIPGIKLLTTREVEILRKLAGGATNHEIAVDLFISENTVKNHVHNILKKLNLNSRRDLRSFAAHFK
jgi:DNA-binding NarL/FixJ family response regulator